MHDGGTHLQITINGKVVCTSYAIYGTKGTTEDGKEWTSLSLMTNCEKLIPVKKGDKMKLIAHYDEGLHPWLVKS